MSRLHTLRPARDATYCGAKGEVRRSPDNRDLFLTARAHDLTGRTARARYNLDRTSEDKTCRTCARLDYEAKRGRLYRG